MCACGGSVEGVWSPGTRVTDCEPPYGCWESNLGPLQEQQVRLIGESSSLQPLILYTVLRFALTCCGMVIVVRQSLT